jgi:hypothetical protein
MAITRSQTVAQGPMTRARARAAAANKKSNTTTTKFAAGPHKITKKKSCGAAGRPRTRRVVAAAAAADNVQEDAASANNVQDFVFTKMKVLVESEWAQHRISLVRMIRSTETFDQFHGLLMSLDAVIDHAVEEGQEVAEDRDVEYARTAWRFFGSSAVGGRYV